MLAFIVAAAAAATVHARIKWRGKRPSLTSAEKYEYFCGLIRGSKRIVYIEQKSLADIRGNKTRSKRRREY